MHLEQSGNDGEPKEEWPSVFVTQNAAHAQHLGQEDRDGDDQLVHGSDLKKNEISFLATVQCAQINRFNLSVGNLWEIFWSIFWQFLKHCFHQILGFVQK